jgi:hypothetical protein
VYENEEVYLINYRNAIFPSAFDKQITHSKAKRHDKAQNV